jgi:hypothetical protein
VIERTLQPRLRQAAGPFRVLFVTGPRQSGKTTLARITFPDYLYVSLDTRVVPIEIKSGATVASDAFRGLEAYDRLALAAARAGEPTVAPANGSDTPPTLGRGILVYGGEEWYTRRGHDVRPWWAVT